MGWLAWTLIIIGYPIAAFGASVVIGRRLKAERRRLKPVPAKVEPDKAIDALIDRVRAIEIELGRIDAVAERAQKTARSAIGSLGAMATNNRDGEPEQVAPSPRFLRGMRE